jgi:hypothetical protein
MLSGPFKLLNSLLLIVPCASVLIFIGIGSLRGTVQGSTQSTSNTLNYFPPEQASTPIFSPILAHLREPSLFEAAKNPDVVSFRASYFSPVPTREIVIRLDVNAEGSGQITAAVSTGTESEVRRTQNDVSVADVKNLLQLLTKVEFWSLSSTETGEKKTGSAGRNVYVMDGSYWMVEGVNEGLFHYVYRQNPKPSAITEIACNLAKDLAKPDDSTISKTFCTPRGH